MILPTWTREDSFWHRHVSIAELAEEACDEVIRKQLEKWLADIQRRDGPSAEETA